MFGLVSTATQLRIDAMTADDVIAPTRCTLVVILVGLLI
jgi:hypothetical protein